MKLKDIKVGEWENRMEKIKKMYVVWTILVIIIFTLLTTFGFIYKKKMSVYKDLEAKLVEAEKKYVDANFLYPENKEMVKTTSTTLIENNDLDGLDIENDSCTGYAIIYNKNGVYEYKGFVKCEKYTTKGYE